MPLSTRALQTLTRPLQWRLTGAPQRTLAAPATRSGTALHSGASTTARLIPAAAGEGRYFAVGPDRARVAARVGNVVASPLCTELREGKGRVRTVEHLLSALEGVGVDNCRIEVDGGDEVPLLDGSAKEWVECIEQVGLCDAEDCSGNNLERMAPVLCEPISVWRNDAFIIALPSSQFQVTYGIDFPQVRAIGCQWFSCVMDASTYIKEIAPARTFCIYEQIERLRGAGLIQGGSKENALICSATAGWLNPPLRFDNEPCRHKVLDLIGDFSLVAYSGNQGIPLGHIIAYKAGHSLHAEFVRCLSARC